MFKQIRRGIFLMVAVALVGCATTDRHGPAPVQDFPLKHESPSYHPAIDPDTGERQPLMELHGAEWIRNGISISLRNQELFLFENGEPVLRSPISSGARGYETITGDFRVQSKSPMVLSRKYPNALGEPAEMPWSLCFSGNYCIHAGYLPGHPASHGCIRLPRKVAKRLYDRVSEGTLVVIRQ